MITHNIYILTNITWLVSWYSTFILVGIENPEYPEMFVRDEDWLLHKFSVWIKKSGDDATSF